MNLLRFYDFFAGGGLATLGLSPDWECVWANDIDPKKAGVYRRNFGDAHFHLGDIAKFTAADLPNHSQLAWASFPCQDLSLAGWQRGLSANRSGTFWPFWKIMMGQFEAESRPPIIVLENVVGLLHGDSFTGLCEALAALGMQYGALVMDARRFLPQSRPRVFVVAADFRLDCSEFVSRKGVPEWTTTALVNAYEQLPPSLADLWRWWQVPAPSTQVKPAETLIEDNPTGVDWQNPSETKRLLSMMNPLHRRRISDAQQAGGRHIGFVYKRIRDGVQRAEVRFDGVAGCLRTPKGGSSRQTVVVVEGGTVRSRLLSPREAARLMGVPDHFKLPESYNDGYKAMGDAVAVPVVSWLSRHLLVPLAEKAKQKINGNYHAAIHRLAVRAEKRATGWSKEHKPMASAELSAACEKLISEWHHSLDSRKSSSLDSFIANAGLKITELTKTRWPIERSDYVSTGGRFRSTGLFIQNILKRQFGEEREYTREGGRTTGSCIDAAANLVARLEKLPQYQKASAADRAAVAASMQEWIYKNIVKPSLDHEGLKVEIGFQKTPPEIIADILAAATRQNVSGAVAQHLVGAKLALRFPEKEIENHGHTTQDKQLGRQGDFAINDTIIHVTMTPGDAVIEKCAQNVRDGFEALLLVPMEEFPVAQSLVKRSAVGSRIWIQSIESFVGQNIAEIAEFGRSEFRENIKELLRTYNRRVEEVETRKALLIKLPENL